MQCLSERLSRACKYKGSVHITGLLTPFNNNWYTRKTQLPQKRNMEWDARSSEIIVMGIGESTRPFYLVSGLRETTTSNVTRSSTTGVGDHLKHTVYSLEITSSTILAIEEDTYKRRLLEFIEIACQVPTLNKDEGYELQDIYQGVLSRDSQTPYSRDKKPSIT